MRMARLSFVVAMAATACLVVPSANGQVQPPASSDRSEQTPNISDQKLEQTAAALKQAIGVKRDYEQRSAEAAPSEHDRLAEEGGRALEKAVTDQGLSVEEFNAIIIVAQNDPGIREKIRQNLRSSE
jgi:hypothetical protein